MRPNIIITMIHKAHCNYTKTKCLYTIDFYKLYKNQCYASIWHTIDCSYLSISDKVYCTTMFNQRMIGVTLFLILLMGQYSTAVDTTVLCYIGSWCRGNHVEVLYVCTLLLFLS